MKKIHLLLMCCIAFLYSQDVFSQAVKTYPDHLSVPGPLAFDGKSYNLAWSANPSANYYKQEYITKGDNVEKFKSMILLEVLAGDAKVKDIVAAKLEELKKMKAANPIVNYEVFQKDGEFILDFLLSANSADGRSIDILERNVYRYKSLSGQKGVVLFAVSTRAYGAEAEKFLVNLKATKSRLVNAVAQFAFPAVKIK